MPKIFLYGVPGTGKTYISRKLGKHYNLQIIEGDKLKKLALQNIPKSQNPFLYLGTCQAWKEFGELSENNAIKGLLAVRQAYTDFIKQHLNKKGNFIFEAAFLDPNNVGNENFRSLLVATDKSQHRRQFYHHREKLLDFRGNEFKAARLIQEYLIAEAKKLNLSIINNNGSNDVFTISKDVIQNI